MATYQISSGQGPAECELAVAKLLDYFRKRYALTLASSTPGYNKGTYRSVRFSAAQDLSEYLGPVQWICRSPYRPAHKRKNWFIQMTLCGEAEKQAFDESQIHFETFRSGGSGGQNVNKVETDVRAIYEPTGLSVVCTEERSQLMNKQRAAGRLRQALKKGNAQSAARAVNRDWQRHTCLERGNAAVTFCGMEFEKSPEVLTVAVKGNL